MRSIRGGRLMLALGVAVGALVFGGAGALARSNDDLSATTTASGTIQPSAAANASFAGSGRIVGVFVREGERVAKGQPLARLDPTAARAQLRQALAGLPTAPAQLLQLT